MLRSRLVIISFLALLGLSVPLLPLVSNWSQQAQETFEENRLHAYCKWGSAPNMNEPGWYDHYAQYDFIAFHPEAYRAYPKAEEELKIRNIDIHLGAYFPIFHTNDYMRRAWEAGATGSFGYKYWDIVHENFLLGEDGKPSSVFNDPTWIMWDVSDIKVRHKIIALIDEYVRAYNLTWVMLDFFNEQLPVGSNDVDLDNDNVPYYDDFNERMWLLKIWETYIKELRAVLPSSTMIIPNGNFALKYDHFAALLDGAYVEDFPRYHFGSTLPNWRNTIDPDYERSLWYLTSDRWNRYPGFVLLEESNTPTGDREKIALFFPGAVTTYLDTNYEPGVYLPVTQFEQDFGAYKEDPQLVFNREEGILIRREFDLAPFLLYYNSEGFTVIEDLIVNPH